MNHFTQGVGRLGPDFPSNTALKTELFFVYFSNTLVSAEVLAA